MGERIEVLEKSVLAIDAEIKAVGQAITAGFKKTDTNFEHIVKEIASIHRDLDRLNKKVDDLKGDTHDGFEDVGMKLENLTDEIVKIGKVTGYDETFENLKGLN